MTEEFDSYRKTVLDKLGGRDPIEVLSGTVSQVRELTEGIPTERLAIPPAPGEWSAQQVLNHLYDTDLVYAVRIRMILTQDNPPLPGYDQDAWTERFGGLDETPRQTLLRWRWVRESNLRLYRTLTEAEWERAGLHSERGEESVRLIVDLLAGHDLMHVDQMVRCLSG